jgi:hypothetical protein
MLSRVTNLQGTDALAGGTRGLAGMNGKINFGVDVGAGVDGLASRNRLDAPQFDPLGFIIFFEKESVSLPFEFRFDQFPFNDDSTVAIFVAVLRTTVLRGAEVNDWHARKIGIFGSAKRSMVVV